MIQVLQELSRPGGAVNEDRIWYSDTFLAVLDGSTSLVPSPLDGHWFTRALAGALAADPSEDLPQRVNSALEAVCRTVLAETEGASVEYYPSAAGIFVQQRANMLEILAIGDCTGLFFMEDGSVVKATEQAVKELDGRVLERCQEIQAQTGQSIAELVGSQEIRDMLVENRKKMNRPQGYRILSVGMPPCREEDLLRLPAEKVRRIVLCSDGFDEVQDRLLDPHVRLEELYSLLRQMEAEDPGFDRMPRFKPGDDASALIARVSVP